MLVYYLFFKCVFFNFVIMYLWFSVMCWVMFFVCYFISGVVYFVLEISVVSSNGKYCFPFFMFCGVCDG